MIDEKIAIIGGTGKFGQHLGEALEKDNKITIGYKKKRRMKE